MDFLSFPLFLFVNKNSLLFSVRLCFSLCLKKIRVNPRDPDKSVFQFFFRDDPS